jgi:hypothetical protein
MRLIHTEDAKKALRKTLVKVGAKLDEIKLPSMMLPSSLQTTISGSNPPAYYDEDTTESMARLEQINREIVEEQERQLLVRDSGMACLEEMIMHLQQFLVQEPHGTYEEWIACLHPENVTIVKQQKPANASGFRKDSPDSTDNDILVLDHRFYVTDSDHRKLWNAFLDGVRSPAFPRDSCLQKCQHQNTSSLCCGEIITGLP